MAKMTKKHKEALSKFEKDKEYSLEEAVEIVKNISYAKFDASVDLNVRLGVDPRKANQMVRGSVTLPHGTGKEKRVLVLCTPDKEEEAKAAGADFVGLDEYVQKIKDGWTDVDVVITMPSVMPKVGALGRILGPRGLMPNPKTGTVTMEIGSAVEAAKAGKIDFKVDKYGIVHSAIGKLNFSKDKILDNANELLQTIIKLKPAASKGTYVLSTTISSTMSPGVKVNIKSVNA
ncbi:MAG: 50S ribosomal protein L1 [Marinilabiliales bacterium]|nr:MAG: 50S ribosomal protein L1 [Marinilabiliales bacterium]